LASGLVLALLAVNAVAQESPAGARSDIVLQALSLLGTPYRYGGASPESGFDCSGLVRHVFASVLNQDLPRRSEEISAVGQPVSRAEIQPGDLLFFNTLRRAFSHVAIYIGGGRFVHAPARNGHVRIEGLDDRYWATRFNGARRLVGASPPGGVAGQGGDGLMPSAPETSPRAMDLGPDRPPTP
jgi:cell wall-associated NlpC family hydrolase